MSAVICFILSCLDLSISHFVFYFESSIEHSCLQLQWFLALMFNSRCVVLCKTLDICSLFSFSQVNEKLEEMQKWWRNRIVLYWLVPAKHSRLISLIEF